SPRWGAILSVAATQRRFVQLARVLSARRMVFETSLPLLNVQAPAKTTCKRQYAKKRSVDRLAVEIDIRLPGRQTSAQNCGEITNGGVWLRQQMITLLCLLHCCRRGRRSLRDTPPFVKERQRMGHPALFCDLLSRITLTSVGPSFLASSARAEYRLR